MNIEANPMKLLIIKCAYPMKSDGLKKYEDEFNRMIRENGYLILPSGFETEVVEVDCLDVFAPKLVTITNLNEGRINLERRKND